MANTFSANVHRIDTTANLAGPVRICGVKYIGNTNGTAIIEANGTDSNIVLWEEEGTANIFDDVTISDSNGVRVEVTNGAVVYIYLETE